MIQSVISSKGETVLPEPVRDALGVSPGDQIFWEILGNNRVQIFAKKSISGLFGSLKYDGPPISLEDMDKAIADECNKR